MQRYLEKDIQADLGEKMVFLWWPRQVGKTTLAQHIWSSAYHSQYTYLNRDNMQHKKKILQAEYNTDSTLIILDEIHKYSGRKNFVKWEYDVKNKELDFLVTGSARLNVFQKWWDSLLGRYRYYTLHPYSLAELLDLHPDGWDIQRLLQYGGFPESYEKSNNRHHTRRVRDRKIRLVREDVRDLTQIKHIGKLELLVSLLESKVGSQFSIKSLVEDVQVTHKTLSHRVDVLEHIYYARRLYPLQSTRIKSLRKEPKLYLRDRSEVQSEWARIENMVWAHLLKRVHRHRDTEGVDIALHYLRDREWREVDFVLSQWADITHIIEVKKSSTKISRHLKYFAKKLSPTHTVQVIYNIDPEHDVMVDGVRVVSMQKFLGELK